jgi:hypothetical protein
MRRMEQIEAVRMISETIVKVIIQHYQEKNADAWNETD